jgi:hypothetical protein
LRVGRAAPALATTIAHRKLVRLENAQKHLALWSIAKGKKQKRKKKKAKRPSSALTVVFVTYLAAMRQLSFD